MSFNSSMNMVGLATTLDYLPITILAMVSIFVLCFLIPMFRAISDPFGSFGSYESEEPEEDDATEEKQAPEKLCKRKKFSLNKIQERI